MRIGKHLDFYDILVFTINCTTRLREVTWRNIFTLQNTRKHVDIVCSLIMSAGYTVMVIIGNYCEGILHRYKANSNNYHHFVAPSNTKTDDPTQKMASTKEEVLAVSMCAFFLSSPL